MTRATATTPSFFVQMGASSALALVRGFVIAWLLSAAGFGIYALIVGIGTFSASVLGLGRIEQTNKIFPRLFVDGRWADARREADAVARLLGRNAVLAVAAAVAALLVAGRSEWIGAALAAGGVALGVAWVAIYMSLQRASGDLSMVGRANIARTLIALVLSAAGASLGSWPGAIAGEVAAAFLGAWIFRRFARRSEGAPTATVAADAGAGAQRYWLFGGFLLAAVPLYLDRTFVVAVYGAAAAGAYAFLMLFVTAAATVTTILVQKIGPQIVRMERQGAGIGAQIGLMARWGGAMIAISAVGMAAAAFVLLEGPAAALGAKYGLTPALLAATAVLSFTQVSTMLDWILLSRDRERLVFLAAAIYLAAIASSAVLVVEAGAPLIAAIWALAAGKLLQIIVQTGLILRLRSKPGIAHGV